MGWGGLGFGEVRWNGQGEVGQISQGRTEQGQGSVCWG